MSIFNSNDQLNLFKTPNKNDFATQNHFRNTPLSRVPTGFKPAHQHTSRWPVYQFHHEPILYDLKKCLSTCMVRLISLTRLF
jgi:hypothetical protein